MTHFALTIMKKYLPPRHDVVGYDAMATIDKLPREGQGLVRLVAAVASLVLSSVGHAADYETQIKPLLRERCYACHGALKQKADLRLDTVTSMVEGKVIIPSKPDASIILRRVATTDLDERMPPEHEGEPLSMGQIALLKEWIVAGAPSPFDEQPEPDPDKHWAFQTIVRPKIPLASNVKWIRNSIDAFIVRRHRERELVPQSEAPRVILLRRLYLDLIGIPPSAEEIVAFQGDPSPDCYERLVMRLLNDPRHGERWARHWMDIWRYSDWWGLGEQRRNSQKHIWHWRDWIVESLNDDTPYDEMVRQMLAGDELYPNDLSKVRATGFLARNYFIFNRTQWMEETVEHVAKSFLGLTMNCAKCHDHKYDPIEQSDFYRMRAFFEPYHVRLDKVPGEPDLTRDGIPRVFDALLDKPTYRYFRGDEKNPDKSTVIKPGVPRQLAFKELDIHPVTLPTEAWQPERRSWVLESYLKAARKELESAQGEWNINVAKANLECIKRRVAATHASWKGVEDETRHVAIRAERQLELVKAQRALALAKKDEVKLREALKKAESGASAPITEEESYTPFTGAAWSATRFLDSTKDDPTMGFPSQSTGRRTALADWITDRRNPLTARVAANHLWTRHMGKPLVENVFDFGRNGTPLTHPHLLDWLATELIESGWSMKHLHRVIVSSAAYRMRSAIAGGHAQTARDPDNRYWWRRDPIRMESQVVRDSILSLSGNLDPSMGGPPVTTQAQASSNRRSLYFFHSNNDRNLFLIMFDEASVNDCYRREQSIVPQQALALTNSDLVLNAAPKIVTMLSGGEEISDDTFIRKAFTTLLGITASVREISMSQQALIDWRNLPNTTMEKARAHLVWALINHNDFVTLR